MSREEFCREYAGEHLSFVSDGLDKYDWQGVWPEIDESGLLTGEVVDGEDCTGVSLDDDGEVVRDRHNPQAMMRS